jgi:hypothetical protein
MEVAGEEGSSKRPRGRLLATSTRMCCLTTFCNVHMTPGIRVLPLPEAIGPYLGPVLGNMIVKTTTCCQRKMNIKEVSGKAVLKLAGQISQLPTT